MVFSRTNKIKSIYPLAENDLPLVKDLLNTFDLLVSDLENAPVKFFGQKENNNLIAAGALEIYGEDAILRSVVVHKNYHKQGFGKNLIRFLETKAKEAGIKNLFLLTTTAESFFRKLNYHPVKRGLCPAEIQASSEFKETCPSTASCLFKDLSVEFD